MSNMKKNFKFNKIEKQEIFPSELVPLDLTNNNDYDIISMEDYKELLEHTRNDMIDNMGIPTQEVKTVNVKLIKKKLDGNTVIMMCTEEGFPCGIYTKQTTTRDKESESDISIEIPISNSKVRELFDEPNSSIVLDIVKTINAAHGYEKVDGSDGIIFDKQYEPWGYKIAHIIHDYNTKDYVKDFMNRMIDKINK